MEFLEKLYSHEDFGIYLFAVIAILVIAFLIILFFGKKDEKNKEQEEINDFELEPKEIESVAKNVVEENNEPTFANEVFESNISTTLEQVKEQEEIAQINNINFEEQTAKTSNPTENSLFSFEEIKEEPTSIELDEQNIVSNVVLNESITNDADEILKKEFDFDALADAISKELDSLNNREPKNEVKKIIKEEKVETNEIKPIIEEEKFVFPNFEPVVPDELPIDFDSKPVNFDEPKEEKVFEEVKPRPIMPNVFSSVYINRETPNEVKTEEVRKVEKPKFDLPKKVELPKKAEPVITEEKEVFSFENIIEDNKDSYDI